MYSDEFEVTPDGWLSRGQAFVRGDGAQMVVHGGIPGERARVKIVSRSPHQIHARFIEPIGAASTSRADPACDRYFPCGRCPMMHLHPGALDLARRRIVEEALYDVGITLKIEKFLSAPPLNSVHTLEVITGYSDQRHLRIGVAGSNGREVLPIPNCPISTPSLRDWMRTLAYHCIRLDIHAFDGKNGTLRKARVIEIPGADGRQHLLITLYTQRRNAHLKDLADSLGTDLSEIDGVIIHNEVEDPDGEDLWVAYGRDHVEWHPAGLRMRVGARDPFPARPDIAAEAARDAVAALSPMKGDAVLDIGAGNGLRTLLLAKKAGWALGVDTSEPAAARARENASLNRINAEFSTGTVVDALTNPRLHDLRPLVYIDLERKGLESAAFDALIHAAPRRVALECTNPRALARDIRRLQERGFTLRSVSAYDTAPYTPFMSCVALMASTDTSGPERRAPVRRRVR